MGKSKAKGEEAKPKKDKSALPPHLATQHDYVICGPEANAHVRVCCERGMRVCVCVRAAWWAIRVRARLRPSRTRGSRIEQP